MPLPAIAIVGFLIYSFLIDALFLHAKPSKGVPLISIDTKGQETKHASYIKASIFLHSKGLDSKNLADDDEINDRWLPIKIKVRGHSSRNFDKKQYQIKFLDSNGKVKPQALLGLPQGEKWVLSAPYIDQTLMRNVLVYAIGRSLSYWGTKRWFAPRTQFFELMINKEYRGVYVLTEKISISQERLNINQPNLFSPQNSGYILAMEGNKAEFKTKYGSRLEWRHPNRKMLNKWTKIDASQAKAFERYVINEVENFEKSLKSPSFADSKQGYQKHINVDSFVDYMLVQELFKNIDGYRRSVHFHRGSDGKIHMGPLWDFNFTMGNLLYYNNHTSKGWNFEKNRYLDGNHASFWFRRLMEDSNFVAKFCRRFHSLLEQGIIAPYRLQHLRQSYTNELGDAVARNFKVWGKRKFKIKEQVIFHNPFWLHGYDSNHAYMQAWYEKRLKWMRHHLASLCPKQCKTN